MTFLIQRIKRCSWNHIVFNNFYLIFKNIDNYISLSRISEQHSSEQTTHKKASGNCRLQSRYDFGWPGPAMPWSLAGAPNQRWRLGRSQQRKHQIPGTRPAVSDRAPASTALQEKNTTRQKVVKHIFIRRKSTVRMDRHMGRLRDPGPRLCPGGSLNHVCAAFLPDFLWPLILICLGSQSIFCIFQDLPMCVHTS